MKIIFFCICNILLICSIKQKSKYDLKNPSSSFSSTVKLLNQNESNSNNEFNSSEVIELESEFIITQLRWTKKEDYDLNYLLGIFEGANDPSFLDAVPLAIIKGEIKVINYIDINTTNTYKYVRYIPPNKNCTEIQVKIYGYKKFEGQEIIKNQNVFQATNLPLIYIYTENKDNPTQLYHKFNCTVLIINEGKIEINETATIKLRGKTSASIPTKKPYKLKFNKKQKILGFEGKFKNWALMANAFDRSLLRNALAYKISELIGFEYSPRCAPVDLILNGNYRGNYYICDIIEVGKNRVNLDKIEKTDISDPNITGGYLMEFDGGVFYEEYYGNKHYTSKGGMIYKIENPKDDEIVAEQENYVLNFINKVEAEVFKGNIENLGLEEFAKFFLVNEFCGDIDFLWSSCYFHKKRNDDKLYFGPVWDFDLALDNHEALIPTNEKNYFCFQVGGSAGTLNKFVSTLIRKKEVINYIQKTWKDLCNTKWNQTFLLEFLEEREKYLKESSELNFLKWDNNFEKIPWEGRIDEKEDYGRKGENFEESVQVLKDYVKLRFNSLTKLIDNAVLKGT